MYIETKKNVFPKKVALLEVAIRLVFACLTRASCSFFSFLICSSSSFFFFFSASSCSFFKRLAFCASVSAGGGCSDLDRLRFPFFLSFFPRFFFFFFLSWSDLRLVACIDELSQEWSQTVVIWNRLEEIELEENRKSETEICLLMFAVCLFCYAACIPMHTWVRGWWAWLGRVIAVRVTRWGWAAALLLFLFLRVLAFLPSLWLWLWLLTASISVFTSICIDGLKPSIQDGFLSLFYGVFVPTEILLDVLGHVAMAAYVLNCFVACHMFSFLKSSWKKTLKKCLR